MIRGNSRPSGDNSGVVNYGTMGNVQNQPGATNSPQSQTHTSTGSDLLKEFTTLLDRIRQQLAAEQDRVNDYQQCVVLLGLTAQQRLDDTGGRSTARAMLEQILAKCDASDGTYRTPVYSSAAVAYSPREVALSRRLISHFTQGTATPAVMTEWWEQARPTKVLRSREREAVLELWLARA
ncbi:hypothetical protein ACIBJF_16635 [Streptomyces sp. NPDC050743]|uniref:hypothetical protein n=1 Tax=Streptomyces sp. NPDC050743 TaxID=3365634 RepID=UPI0037A35BC3